MPGSPWPLRAATGAAPVPRRRRRAIAVKEEKLEMEGEITESLRNRMFRITLDNGHEMIGYTAGKMKRTATADSTKPAMARFTNAYRFLSTPLIYGMCSRSSTLKL